MLLYSQAACSNAQQALRLLDLYSAHGIDQSRVYIKIASTWEGIQACAALQKQSIACNMTLLFNLAQVGPVVPCVTSWHSPSAGSGSS